MTGLERRQNPRTTVTRIAYVNLEPDNGGILLNVSEGGLSFQAVAPVDSVDQLHFGFSLRADQRIEAHGELAWSDESRKAGGVRFTQLSPGAREQIRRWLSPAQPPTTVHASAPPSPPPRESAPLPRALPPIQPYHYEAKPRRSWRRPSGSFIASVILLLLVAGALLFPDYSRQLGASFVQWIEPSPDFQPPTLPAPDLPAPAAVSETAPPARNFNPPASTDGPAAKSAAPNPASAPPSSGPSANDGRPELAAAQSYLRGADDARDSGAAAALLWKSVEKGNLTAEFLLADLYARGDGVAKSCEQARVLLTDAARAGNAEALARLAQFDSSGCQ